MTSQTDSTQKYGRFSLKELKAWGVLIEKVDATLTNQEKETSISFNEADSVCECATFNDRWMKRIEDMGIWPEAVYVHRNAEVRFYRTVPKSRLKPPLPLPKRSAKQRALDKKRAEELRVVRPGTRH
jgi:hypothetical protein